METFLSLLRDVPKTCKTNRNTVPLPELQVTLIAKRFSGLPTDATKTVVLWSLPQEESVYFLIVSPRHIRVSSNMTTDLDALARSVLPVATIRGDISMMTRILTAFGQLVNMTLQEWGWSILAEAVKHDQLNAVRFLLDRGANVNQPSLGGSFATALHQAAWRGNIDCMQLLLERGAFIDARTKGGNLPIHHASNTENVYAVQYLYRWARDTHKQLDYAPPNKHCKMASLELIFLAEEGPTELTCFDLSCFKK